MRFLSRHGIDSREQLAEYRKPLLDEIAALTKERHGLYRSAPDSPRIGQITARLKVLRKESRMCGRIEKHSMEIGQRLAEARAEQKNMWKRKNRKVLIKLRKDGTPCREIVDRIKNSIRPDAGSNCTGWKTPGHPSRQGRKGRWYAWMTRASCRCSGTTAAHWRWFRVRTLFHASMLRRKTGKGR